MAKPSADLPVASCSSSATVASPHRRQLDQMPDPELAHARRGAEWTFDARAYHACLAQIKATGGGLQGGGHCERKRKRRSVVLLLLLPAVHKAAGQPPASTVPFPQCIAGLLPTSRPLLPMPPCRRGGGAFIRSWCGRPGAWGHPSGAAAPGGAVGGQLPAAGACHACSACCPELAAQSSWDSFCLGCLSGQWRLQAVAKPCSGRHSKACCALPTPSPAAGPPHLVQGAEPWWKLHQLFDEVGAPGQVISSMLRLPLEAAAPANCLVRYPQHVRRPSNWPCTTLPALRPGLVHRLRCEHSHAARV